MAISLLVTSQAYVYRAVFVMSGEPAKTEQYSNLEVAQHAVRRQLDTGKGKPLPEVKHNRLAPELWEVTYTQPDNKTYVIGYVVRFLELLAQEH